MLDSEYHDGQVLLRGVAPSLMIIVFWAR